MHGPCFFSQEPASGILHEPEMYASLMKAMILSENLCHDGSCHDCICRVVAVIRTYMTYVWGFGVAKPVPGLQPQTVGADEDREGVRDQLTLQLMPRLAKLCSNWDSSSHTKHWSCASVTRIQMQRSQTILHQNMRDEGDKSCLMWRLHAAWRTSRNNIAKAADQARDMSAAARSNPALW